MNITYIHHSGFLVETGRCYYLFDYESGDLPELDTAKPVFVLSSHSHDDHYEPEIFKLLAAAGMEQVRAILSDDIDIPDGVDTLTVSAGQDYELGHQQKLSTFQSTDLGVAFLLEEDGKLIYHAGDLNWWHWNGEPDFFNDDIKRSYTTEIDKLKGEKIDVAFVPADLRLEDKYFWAVDYFRKTVGADVIFPMHFWGRFDVCDMLRELGFANVMKITEENQIFEI